MIEIGFCADNNYAMPCGVCITSIFEHNKDNKIRVHILTNGFSEENKLRFQKTAEKYNQIIDIYIIDEKLLEGLPIISKRFSIMTYARLFFHDILDKSIDKVLYLDSDIYVAGNIVDLWNTDITDYAVGAIPDVCADDICDQNRIETYTPYINAGVLLMNLAKWREKNFTYKCIDFALTKKTQMQDQDAINAVMGDNMYYLNMKYNLMIYYYQNPTSKLRLHKKRWSELEEAKKNPSVLHYTAAIKPWHKEYDLPKQDIYIDMIRKSQWSDYKIKYRNTGIQLLKYYIFNTLVKLKPIILKSFS